MKFIYVFIKFTIPKSFAITVGASEAKIYTLNSRYVDVMQKLRKIKRKIGG